MATFACSFEGTGLVILAFNLVVLGQSQLLVLLLSLRAVFGGQNCEYVPLLVLLLKEVHDRIVIDHLVCGMVHVLDLTVVGRCCLSSASCEALRPKISCVPAIYGRHLIV